MSNVFQRLRARLTRRERAAEDIAGEREARRIADEITSNRVATKSQAGDTYLSQRRSRY